MTGLPWIIAAPVLVALVLALVALERLRRDLHVPLRRMLATASAARSRVAARRTDLRGEVDTLETAVEEMNACLEARTAALEQACALAGLGTWTIRPDQGSVRASSNIGAMLGFPENDDFVPLDRLRSRIVAQDRADFDAAFARAVHDGRMTELEFHVLDGDDRIRVLRASTAPGVAMPDEPAAAVSGIIQDITDLRRKETALTESQYLERLAGDVAHIGGWRYDVATRMFNGTQATARIVGLESDGWDDVIEDAMDRFDPGQGRARVERSFWTCVGSGTGFDEIAKFRKFDGEETWLRMIGEADRDASGAIVGVHGATHDVGELIRARSAQDDVRALLQTILDDMDDGFVIHGWDGTIQYMNHRAHSILGVTDGTIVGGNIWQDIPQVLGAQFERAVSDAVETGERQTFEGEIVHPDQWVQVTVHPTGSGIAIYLNDVTEQRAARMRLQLLDAAMKQVSDVVLITEASPLDAPGPRTVFTNEAFVDITGYAQEDILGVSPRVLQGPKTEKRRLAAVRKALRNRRHVRVELTNYRKDGTPYTNEIDINPLFDDAGVCTHFVSVQRDTTGHRQKEEQLRAREEQFRLASLASRDVMWDWDLITGVIWNSDTSDPTYRVAAQAGADSSETASIAHALERVHPDDRHKISESLDAALSGNDEAWRCDYRIKDDTGAWRHVSDRAFILRDDDGTPRRMVGAMSDVTEIRALDARLHQAQKLETVGQLTGGIAHDFNNLLTIILGNCDILLDDMGDDAALRPLLQSIEDAAERGAGVSRDLLAFSRRQPLEARPTDINALIRRSSSLFDRAVSASVELRHDLTEEPAVALVDPDKLQAAVLNLVMNAVAAIPGRGTITVRTRPADNLLNDGDVEIAPGGYVAIEVADDGAGMTPEVRDRAFEPFFTTKEAGVGTGMGLSSVYGLVKQSNGHASITSEPGKGTTITLCLPVAHEAPEWEEPAHVTAPPQLGAGHRILVVEDDVDLRTFVKTVLSRMGYDIVEAGTGTAAIDILKEDDAFDLVFTDIVMPGGVNGVQLAEEAQEMYPGMKVLFTSGYARDALPNDRHVPSNIPMLSKPFRTRELVAKVEAALANPPAPTE